MLFLFFISVFAFLAIVAMVMIKVAIVLKKSNFSSKYKGLNYSHPWEDGTILDHFIDDFMTWGLVISSLAGVGLVGSIILGTFTHQENNHVNVFKSFDGHLSQPIDGQKWIISNPLHDSVSFDLSPKEIVTSTNVRADNGNTIKIDIHAGVSLLPGATPDIVKADISQKDLMDISSQLIANSVYDIASKTPSFCQNIPANLKDTVSQDVDKSMAALLHSSKVIKVNYLGVASCREVLTLQK